MKSIDFFNRSKSEIFAKQKQLLELHDYVVKLESSNKKTLIYKFFFENYVEISISTIVWQRNKFLDYKRYKSNIAISKEELFKYTEKELKIILLSDIYKQIIQNNIMMI